MSWLCSELIFQTPRVWYSIEILPSTFIIFIGGACVCVRVCMDVIDMLLKIEKKEDEVGGGNL